MGIYWWSKHTRDPKLEHRKSRGGATKDYVSDPIPFEPNFWRAHRNGLLLCVFTVVGCLWILDATLIVSTRLLGGWMYPILCVFSLLVATCLPIKWSFDHRRLLRLEDEFKVDPKLLSDLE